MDKQPREKKPRPHIPDDDFKTSFERSKVVNFGGTTDILMRNAHHPDDNEGRAYEACEL